MIKLLNFENYKIIVIITLFFYTDLTRQALGLIYIQTARYFDILTLFMKEINIGMKLNN